MLVYRAYRAPLQQRIPLVQFQRRHLYPNDPGPKPDILAELRSAPDQSKMKYNKFYKKDQANFFFPIPHWYEPVGNVTKLRNIGYGRFHSIVHFYHDYYFAVADEQYDMIRKMLHDIHKFITVTRSASDADFTTFLQEMRSCSNLTEQCFDRDPFVYCSNLIKVVEPRLEEHHKALLLKDLQHLSKLIVDYRKTAQFVGDIVHFWGSITGEAPHLNKDQGKEFDQLFQTHSLDVSPLCSAVAKNGTRKVHGVLSFATGKDDLESRIKALGGKASLSLGQSVALDSEGVMINAEGAETTVHRSFSRFFDKPKDLAEFKARFEKEFSRIAPLAADKLSKVQTLEDLDGAEEWLQEALKSGELNDNDMTFLDAFQGRDDMYKIAHEALLHSNTMTSDEHEMFRQQLLRMTRGVMNEEMQHYKVADNIGPSYKLVDPEEYPRMPAPMAETIDRLHNASRDEMIERHIGDVAANEGVILEEIAAAFQAHEGADAEELNEMARAIMYKNVPQLEGIPEESPSLWATDDLKQLRDSIYGLMEGGYWDLDQEILFRKDVGKFLVEMLKRKLIPEEEDLAEIARHHATAATCDDTYDSVAPRSKIRSLGTAAVSNTDDSKEMQTYSNSYYLSNEYGSQLSDTISVNRSDTETAEAGSGVHAECVEAMSRDFDFVDSWVHANGKEQQAHDPSIFDQFPSEDLELYPGDNRYDESLFRDISKSNMLSKLHRLQSNPKLRRPPFIACAADSPSYTESCEYDGWEALHLHDRYQEELERLPEYRIGEKVEQNQNAVLDFYLDDFFYETSQMEDKLSPLELVANLQRILNVFELTFFPFDDMRAENVRDVQQAFDDAHVDYSQWKLCRLFGVVLELNLVRADNAVGYEDVSLEFFDRLKQLYSQMSIDASRQNRHTVEKAICDLKWRDMSAAGPHQSPVEHITYLADEPFDNVLNVSLESLGGTSEGLEHQSADVIEQLIRHNEKREKNFEKHIDQVKADTFYALLKAQGALPSNRTKSKDTQESRSAVLESRYKEAREQFESDMSELKEHLRFLKGEASSSVIQSEAQKGRGPVVSSYPSKQKRDRLDALDADAKEYEKFLKYGTKSAAFELASSMEHGMVDPRGRTDQERMEIAREARRHDRDTLQIMEQQQDRLGQIAMERAALNQEYYKKNNPDPSRKEKFEYDMAMLNAEEEGIRDLLDTMARDIDHVAVLENLNVDESVFDNPKNWIGTEEGDEDDISVELDSDDEDRSADDAAFLNLSDSDNEDNDRFIDFSTEDLQGTTDMKDVVDAARRSHVPNVDYEDMGILRNRTDQDAKDFITNLALEQSYTNEQMYGYLTTEDEFERNPMWIDYSKDPLFDGRYDDVLSDFMVSGLEELPTDFAMEDIYENSDRDLGFMVPDAMKEEIFAKFHEDPKKNNHWELAKIFNLRVDRIDAILCMKHLEKTKYARMEPFSIVEDHNGARFGVDYQKLMEIRYMPTTDLVDPITVDHDGRPISYINYKPHYTIDPEVVPTEGPGSGNVIQSASDAMKDGHSENRYPILISDLSKMSNTGELDVTVRDTDGTLRYADIFEFRRADKVERPLKRRVRDKIIKAKREKGQLYEQINERKHLTPDVKHHSHDYRHVSK